MMKMFFICALQYGSQELHVAMETEEFVVVLFLNFNSLKSKWPHIPSYHGGWHSSSLDSSGAFFFLILKKVMTHIKVLFLTLIFQVTF